MLQPTEHALLIWWQHGSKSRHAGGAHVGFGDGRVKFISDSVNDRAVLRAIHSIAGNEGQIPEF